jgi:hypothetical protein
VRFATAWIGRDGVLCGREPPLVSGRMWLRTGFSMRRLAGRVHARALGREAALLADHGGAAGATLQAARDCPTALVLHRHRRTISCARECKRVHGHGQESRSLTPRLSECKMPSAASVAIRTKQRAPGDSTRHRRTASGGAHTLRKAATPARTVTEPLKLIPYYFLNHSTWPLSNNIEVTSHLCWVKPGKSLTSQDRQLYIKTHTKASPEIKKSQIIT